METTSHRPWETHSSNAHVQSAQTLPSIATLTSNIPPQINGRPPSDLSINPPKRDSGGWMPQSAISGTSTHSGNTMPFLNSTHSPTGPSPSTYTPETPSVNHSAFGSHPQVNGVGGSRTEHAIHRGSGDFDDSRRSSAAASIHQGMNNLGLGPTSPYNSNNHSQSSIVSGLQRERGIQSNGYSGGRYSAMSGPLSPFGSRGGGARGFAAGRVAPMILENPKSEVYSADAPTRGQAYAFPDPDARPGRPPSNFSIRNSFAESFTSSILTIESSRLPLGQQELPDSHHHLMSKQVNDIKGDPDSPNSATPYSRTPELRVTHKLAERKRRSEMKDCFDQLRARLPAHQTNKSSKWETLSRAIDYITSLETQVKQQRIDSDKQRHQMQDMELKIQEMSQQMQRLQQQQHQGSYLPPPNVMPQSPTGYNSIHSKGMDNSNDRTYAIPAITNGAMQGIQYSDDRR